MADVTLAEFNGSVWLVGGEQHTDELLFNSLPESVSVELIACDSREQVRNMWVQLCGEPLMPSEPVLIHPRIADRVRRASAGRTVFFAQWSAMMDDDAIAVLRAAAQWMMATPSLRAALVGFVGPHSAPGLADLSRLRMTLVREKLFEFGVDRARLDEQTREPDPALPSGADPAGDSQRIKIEISEAS